MLKFPHPSELKIKALPQIGNAWHQLQILYAINLSYLEYCQEVYTIRKTSTALQCWINSLYFCDVRQHYKVIVTDPLTVLNLNGITLSHPDTVMMSPTGQTSKQKEEKTDNEKKICFEVRQVRSDLLD